MEFRSLEINVMSAKDLKNVNLISKMDVYVVVSVSGDPNSKQKTPVDRNGNTHPTWNFPMKFTVEESAAKQGRLTVDFKVRCDRSLGDKDVGEVHVPLKDLLGSVDDGKVQFVTYQVRKPSGKPKGELSFSYKWGEKFTATAPPPLAMKAEEPVTAYPAPGVGTSSAYPLRRRRMRQPGPTQHRLQADTRLRRRWQHTGTHHVLTGDTRRLRRRDTDIPRHQGMVTLRRQSNNRRGRTILGWGWGLGCWEGRSVGC